MLIAGPFLLSLLSATGRHQSDLDRFLENEWHKSGAPGMSVAVVKTGKLAYAKGFGYADLQNEVKATPETVYRIGSVTKQFTATMIMQLFREGKLQLVDPIRKFLPDLPQSWEKVNIRQLLSHTGGVPNYTALPDVMARAIHESVTPQGIVATVEKMPLDFEPGSRWSYSNTGYEILGMIVEKLDGRPFEASLKARLLGPVGMDHTYFTSNAEIVKHRAQGYTSDRGKTFNASYIDMSWPYAAGSMESTVLDMAKWDAALYTDKVLPQALLKQMWTRIRLTSGAESGYGFGWGVTDVGGTQIVEHNGGIPGFISIIRRAPSKGLTVIVMSNSDRNHTIDVAEHLMGFLDSTLKVEARKAIGDRDPTTTQFAKRTFESILAGNLNRSTLSPELAKLLTPEFLQAARKDFNVQGPLKRFELVATKNEDDKRFRIYRVTLGKSEVEVEFVIGPGNIVQGLNIRG